MRQQLNLVDGFYHIGNRWHGGNNESHSRLHIRDSRLRLTWRRRIEWGQPHIADLRPDVMTAVVADVNTATITWTQPPTVQHTAQFIRIRIFNQLEVWYINMYMHVVCSRLRTASDPVNVLGGRFLRRRLVGGQQQLTELLERRAHRVDILHAAGANQPLTTVARQVHVQHFAQLKIHDKHRHPSPRQGRANICSRVNF